MRSLDCRLRWCVCCVGVGVTWSLVLWAEGARRHRDSQPTERVIKGSKFSWPTVCLRCVWVCVCVFLCLLFISNQFLHLSIPPVLLPPTLPAFLPPPPSLCSTERATDPLGGQINSPVRAAQSAEGQGCSTETTSPATLSHIIHTAHSTSTYTHHLHSLSEYALAVQSTWTFFSSLSSLTPTPLAHLFLKWLLMFFVCFNQWELFWWGLSLSLCIVQVITTSWYSHKLIETCRVQAEGEAGGRRCGGGWMKGGGGGGRSTVIWRVVRRVNTAVPQLRNPIGVHQESYFILNLFPLFTLFLTPLYYLFFFFIMTWPLPYCTFQEVHSAQLAVTHILCTQIAIQARRHSLFKVQNRQANRVIEDMGAIRLGSHLNELIINWIYVSCINWSVLVPLSLVYLTSPPFPHSYLSFLSERLCQVMYCPFSSPNRVQHFILKQKVL